MREARSRRGLSRQRGLSGLARVQIAGAGSALLYAIVYLAQRSILLGGDDGVGLLSWFTLYALATLVLIGLYAFVLSTCRSGLLRSSRAGAVAVAWPVAFQLLLVFGLPTLSIDLMSYISHGYIRAVMGANPYVVPSAALAATPVGPELAAYGWRPVHPMTSYGPLWTHLESAVVGLIDGVPSQLVVLKLVVVTASLGSALLLWMILGRSTPAHQLMGTLAYLWNPVVVVELAGEGHNDAVMVLLVLLALALTVRNAGSAGVAIMGMAVLTKYLPLLLMPLQAAYLWRTRRSGATFFVQVASGAVVGVCAAVLLFAPLWVGPRTLAGLLLLGRPGLTGSTPTLLVSLLSRLLAPGFARWLVPVVTLAVVGAFILWAARRVTDDRSLLHACAAVSVVYLLFASPAYYPWYVVLPVALLALVAHGPFLVGLVALSLGARLVGPLDVLYVRGAVDRPAYLLVTWVCALALPVLAVTVAAARRPKP